MLVSVKLYLGDGRERRRAVEVEDAHSVTAEGILQRIAKRGRVRLGDHEVCRVSDIVRVELVPPPEPRRGPEWSEEGAPSGAHLRDEDVRAAYEAEHGSDRPGD